MELYTGVVLRKGAALDPCSAARHRSRLTGRLFQFEWDKYKALANVGKHGVTFELAATVFNDPHVITVADLTHSEAEDRWFSIGCASNGKILSIVYLWQEVDPALIKIRLISARPAAQKEKRRYTF